MNQLVGEVVITLKNYAAVHFEVINLLCSDHNKPSWQNFIVIFRPIFNSQAKAWTMATRNFPVDKDSFLCLNLELSPQSWCILYVQWQILREPRIVSKICSWALNFINASNFKFCWGFSRSKLYGQSADLSCDYCCGGQTETWQMDSFINVKTLNLWNTSSW